MIEDILLKIGLSEKEVKVYLAALKMGSQPASVIAKAAEVNRTTVYVILKNLVEKGLATKFMRADIWYFTATPPDTLSSFVERQKKELDFAKVHLEELMPEFQKLMQFTKGEAKVRFFEGISGVKALYDETLKRGKTVHEIKFDYRCDHPEIKDLWNVYKHRRKDMGILLRLIVVDNEEGVDLKKRDPSEHRETHLAPKEFFRHGNTQVVIYDNCYAYFSYADNDFHGAIIEDAHMTQVQLDIFEFMWHMTEKYDKEAVKKYKIDNSEG